MIIRIFNEIKGDMNKHLNEFKKNTHKQLCEIRKIMEDIKRNSIEEKIVKKI
jgi:hypothetical protein